MLMFSIMFTTFLDAPVALILKPVSSEQQELSLPLPLFYSQVEGVLL